MRGLGCCFGDCQRCSCASASLTICLLRNMFSTAFLLSAFWIERHRSNFCYELQVFTLAGIRIYVLGLQSGRLPIQFTWYVWGNQRSEVILSFFFFSFLFVDKRPTFMEKIMNKYKGIQKNKAHKGEKPYRKRLHSRKIRPNKRNMKSHNGPNMRRLPINALKFLLFISPKKYPTTNCTPLLAVKNSSSPDMADEEEIPRLYH